VTEERRYDAQDWERARDHVWGYFELHAGQRLTMFNFFVVLSGLVTAGLGATMQGSPRMAVLGILLGVVLMLLSFVFWKLDQRSSFLVKHAEDAGIEIENHLLPPAGRLFASEPARLQSVVARRWLSGIWTFGRSLRFAFGGMALVGAATAAICGLRAAEALTWGQPKATSVPGAPAPKEAKAAQPKAPAGTSTPRHPRAQ
jgi:hypothetical protein